MICTPQQILIRMKKKMGGTCRTYEGEEKCMHGFGEEI
jgi:hypothetical protein